MVGTLKRFVKKLVAANRTERDAFVGRLFGGYRRRPVTDGIPTFEVLFGVRLVFLKSFLRESVSSWDMYPICDL